MTSDAYPGNQSQMYHDNMESGMDILDLLADFEETQPEVVPSVEPEVPENQSKPIDDSISSDDSDEAMDIELKIKNVVAMANLRCHLKLKDLAKRSINVEYKALQNHVNMHLRRPQITATIWSSGKFLIMGARSLSEARIGARRIARRIQKCGFPCKFSNYRVVNILARCALPFRVRLDTLVKESPMQMSYEPEIEPGLQYKLHDEAARVKLFATGRMLILGKTVDSIDEGVLHLYALAAKHRTDEPVSVDEEDFADEEEYERSRRKHRHSRREDRSYRYSRRAMLRGACDSDEADELLDNGGADSFFIDYDDADSDAEENAIIQQRIMRGEGMDDFDDTEDEEENDGHVPSSQDSYDSGASENSEGVSRRRRKRRTKRSSKPFSDKSKPQSTVSAKPSGVIKVFNSQSLCTKTISTGLDADSKKAVASGGNKMAKIVSFKEEKSTDEDMGKSADLELHDSASSIADPTRQPILINSSNILLKNRQQAKTHSNIVVIPSSISGSQPAPVRILTTKPGMVVRPQPKVIAVNSLNNGQKLRPSTVLTVSMPQRPNVRLKPILTPVKKEED